MPTNNFDAAGDDLTYDFTAYVPDAKGTIPEPSTAQVEAFTETLRQVLPTKKTLDGKQVFDVDALAQAVEEGQDVSAIFTAAVADLCSQSPTAKDIEGLPFRKQRAFFGWIVGTFLSPEA